jgi:hypothetical protein
MKYVRFDGMVWSVPSDAMSDLNWKLRYGTPTKRDLLAAAGVLSDYAALIARTRDERQVIVKRETSGKSSSGKSENICGSEMTNKETAAYLRSVVKRTGTPFGWVTDGCGYDQHIRFVLYRNEHWKGGDFAAWTQFVLDYADMLDQEAGDDETNTRSSD